ncbi:hypothetical protein QUB68_15160 [Microcoleus sp. A006_D1]|uniref:hypothetical protein n=1 Tax=Microcoleus sp. A006_D1 TaxID=3055267 RepID=UPI002FD36E3A
MLAANFFKGGAIRRRPPDLNLQLLQGKRTASAVSAQGLTARSAIRYPVLKQLPLEGSKTDCSPNTIAQKLLRTNHLSVALIFRVCFGNLREKLAPS